MKYSVGTYCIDVDLNELKIFANRFEYKTRIVAASFFSLCKLQIFRCVV